MSTKRLHSSAEESASAFFKELIYLKIKNNGMSISGIYMLTSFPRIIANPGISIGRLSVLDGAEGELTEVVIAAIENAVQRMEYLGLVEEAPGKVHPTEKGKELFAFLGDRSRVVAWLNGELRRAESEGVDTARLKMNVAKLTIAINTMLEIGRESAKGARRQ